MKKKLNIRKTIRQVLPKFGKGSRYEKFKYIIGILGFKSKVFYLFILNCIFVVQSIMLFIDD